MSNKIITLFLIPGALVNQPESESEEDGIDDVKITLEANPTLDPETSVGNNKTIKSKSGKSRYPCGQCGK